MSEIREKDYLETDLRLADRVSLKAAEEEARIPLPLSAIAQAISEEVERAKRHGEKFASLHEAYAVILEELDEVWDITRQKRRNRSALDLRKELIQIAAMAVRGLQSMENFIGGKV